MKISKEDIENVESDLNSTFEQAKENKEIALSEQTKHTNLVLDDYSTE